MPHHFSSLPQTHEPSSILSLCVTDLSSNKLDCYGKIATILTGNVTSNLMPEDTAHLLTNCMPSNSMASQFVQAQTVQSVSTIPCKYSSKYLPFIYFFLL